MAYIIIKTILTAMIIVGISEIGKRYTTFAALLAALPLTSLLAMIWLYTDTKDAERIADLLSTEAPILLRYYTDLHLFSEKSRQQFVEPDKKQLPEFE